MIYEDINGLIDQALGANLIKETDQIYVRNRLLALLKLESYPDTEMVKTADSIPNLVDKLLAYAINNHIIEDVFDEKEMLSAQIMDIFVPRPSVVNQMFNQQYAVSPIAATDYFYTLSKNSNYIQMNRIKNNIQFKTETNYGIFDITINLSKPEKDPEQIRRESEIKHIIHYPKCMLCMENEGYQGRTGYPARANHRVIEVPLCGENWYFQYSPYVYYNEHSILLSEEHQKMKINKITFKRLLAFTEKFPHYFIGSNADLPIVGGSILSHDHYQAGHYEFAMTNAKDAYAFELQVFPNVKAAVIDWPLSVIRLQSEKQADLADAADHILTKWKSYSDQSAEILSHTGEVSHNTITPIARRRDEAYELDLVLRNNRTNETHPMGIFHPHEDVQHIKKENIGLIEVMGLAVLPARLVSELLEIKKSLLGKASNIPAYHEPWTKELKSKYGTIQHLDEADKILKKEIGVKFTRVLEDAGIFKNKEAFERFIDEINH